MASEALCWQPPGCCQVAPPTRTATAQGQGPVTRGLWSLADPRISPPPHPGGPVTTGWLWSCPSPPADSAPLQCLDGSRGLDPRTPPSLGGTPPQLLEEGAGAPPVLVGLGREHCQALAGCDAPTERRGLCWVQTESLRCDLAMLLDYIHCDLRISFRYLSFCLPHSFSFFQ